MKYANRPLSLLVAGALVVTLAGCGGSAVSTLTASSAAGTVLSATESEFSLEGATAFTFTDGGMMKDIKLVVQVEGSKKADLK